MGISNRITAIRMHLQNIHEQRTLVGGLIGGIKFPPLILMHVTAEYHFQIDRIIRLSISA